MADLLKRLKISEQQYGVGMEDNPFQDVSNDEAMKVCFGGGGGGRPPPPPPQTVTQQTSNIPEYFQPYLERLFERAEGVTTEPFQRYEGQRLAPITEQQQTAYQGVEDLVGGFKPYIATADVLTSQAAQQSTDPMAIASRMNPYQQSVIDIQKREALRDAEKLQQQVGASAVGAGAFGGSRQALQETELARQTGQRLADIQAVGSQQAYQQALNQLAADRAASLAAGQQFAGLGTTQQQLGLAGLGALETVGQTRQAQQQRPLDIAYEDFARETTFPSQQVQQMSSVLRGFNLPTSTYATTQTQQAQPGFGQQLLGYGSGALGLYGAGKTFGLFKEGGDVNPGLKALAKEAPEAVENMGYDPDEVANAYVGGRMNFQPGGSTNPNIAAIRNIDPLKIMGGGLNINQYLEQLKLGQKFDDVSQRMLDLYDTAPDTEAIKKLQEEKTKLELERLDDKTKDKKRRSATELMFAVSRDQFDPENVPRGAFGTLSKTLSEELPGVLESAEELKDLDTKKKGIELESALAGYGLDKESFQLGKEKLGVEADILDKRRQYVKDLADSANVDLKSFLPKESDFKQYVADQAGVQNPETLSQETLSIAPKIVDIAAALVINEAKKNPGQNNPSQLRVMFNQNFKTLLEQVYGRDENTGLINIPQQSTGSNSAYFTPQPTQFNERIESLNEMFGIN
jgi:hypothetical protein